MKCKHVQQYLLDYSEELLDQRTRFLIEKHLSTCSECAKELHEIEQTIHLLQSIPVQEPPETFWPDFTTSVMRQVRKIDSVPVERRFFFFPNVRVAVAVAALIIIVSGLFFYFSGTFHRLWYPGELTARHSDVPDVEIAIPQNIENDRKLRNILNEIAPNELMEDMLNSDFALVDGEIGAAFDVDYSDDEWLYFLINSLTDEEKDQFLLELYKMK